MELVQEIEELVMESAREIPMENWSKQLRCYQDSCDALSDHYTQEEQYQLYHDLFGCRMSKQCSRGKRDCEGPHKCGPKCPVSQETPQAKQRILDRLEDSTDLDLVLQQSDSWCDRHYEAICDLEAKIDVLQQDTSEPINEEQRVLVEHFGLRLWATEFRQEVEDLYNMADHKFAAYLALPDSTNCERGKMDREHERFAIPVQMSTLPTAKSLQRFPRAMKLLGLKPCVDRQLQDTKVLCPMPSKAVPSKDDDKVEESEVRKSEKSDSAKVTVMPQLVLLGRSTGEYSGY